MIKQIAGKKADELYIGQKDSMSKTITEYDVYGFAGIKRKKFTVALLISVLSYLASVIFSCFLCRLM